MKKQESFTKNYVSLCVCDDWSKWWEFGKIPGAPGMPYGPLKYEPLIDDTDSEPPTSSDEEGGGIGIV